MSKLTFEIPFSIFCTEKIDGKPQNPVDAVDTDANSSILGFTSSHHWRWYQQWAVVTVLTL